MADRTPKLTEQEHKEAVTAFEGLGVCTQLAEAAASLGWKKPSNIQEQAIPHLLQGSAVAWACGRSMEQWPTALWVPVRARRL